MADLDLVDHVDLGGVRQLERGSASVQDDHSSVTLSLEGGKLIEAEHIAVQRYRLVEVIDFDDHSQLMDGSRRCCHRVTVNPHTDVRVKPKNEVLMRIGEVAEATGVSVRLLRYYEERGLLRPDRSVSNQRLYQPDVVERVAQICNLLAAGLSTERINDLLPCFDAPADQRTAHLLESLRAERQRIDATIASLHAAAIALDDVIVDVVQADGGAGLSA